MNRENDSNLEKEFRKKHPWLFNEPPGVVADKENPPILIYQMGKVGSTSITFTLEKCELSNPVHHIHQLAYKGIEWNINKNNERLMDHQKKRDVDKHTWMYTHLYIKYAIRQLEYAALLRKKIDENKNDVPWKIVTLVRDPIMRDISDFFFTFHKRLELMDKEGQLLHRESLKTLTRELTAQLSKPKSWTLSWFDTELKEVFGIDVYRYPFDHEKGYTLIREDNISILVIKLEALNRCFSNAMSELLNIENLELINRNVAEKKFYYDTYRYVLDNIALAPHFYKKVYRSKYARHFYTDDELKNFMKKWSGSKHSIWERIGMYWKKR